MFLLIHSVGVLLQGNTPVADMSRPSLTQLQGCRQKLIAFRRNGTSKKTGYGSSRNLVI
jgi:hypothetical protein